MNYKTELNGWATEMAIKAKAAGMTIAEVIESTKELVEFAFTPHKEYKDALEYFFEIVRNAPSGQANIDALIGTLEHIREDRIRQGIDQMATDDKVVKLETK